MITGTWTQAQRQRARYWLPPLAVGLAGWLMFVFIGQTPLLRASGLTLVIIGMALALRPMGAALTVVGALALAFSPSFWIQTGGAESLLPAEIVLALLAAGALGLVALAVSRHPLLGAALALVVFAGLFLTVVGTPRSLRLTTLLTAWLLYLLVDALLVSNPRPDSPPTGRLGAHHTWGLLLLLGIGILNDPLFALLAPAVALGLFLSKKRLPVFYWLILAAVVAYGVYGIAVQYADSGWWGYSAEAAKQQGLQVPFIIADGWREPVRWIDLIQLIGGQFTVAGLLLGVLGLARLARWYPPLGVVTMVAYGTYALFGLVYFGADASVLLLPLLMIQIVWMTYAVYTFGQWLEKSLKPTRRGVVRWLAPAAFTLLPLLMLARILEAS